jgi:hypothetical protein
MMAVVMERWTVRLPAGVREPFVVFVNGVRQEPGRDYEVARGALHFDRSLEREQPLRKRHWLLGAFGIGTYSRDDQVDVTWTAPDGSPRVAHGLPIEPPSGR